MRAVALLVWLMVAGSAFAQVAGGAAEGVTGTTPQDRSAIQGVINHQLDAFLRDDAAGAYSFAAPNVREIFPTPEIFIDMVRRGYRPVYRPATREFSELAQRDGDLVQEVELTGPDGKPVLALYTMRKSADGTWQIAACVLIASARVGV